RAHRHQLILASERNAHVTTSYPSTHDPQFKKSLFQFERRSIVFLLAAIALGSVACSKLKNEHSTDSPGGGGHTGTSANNSNTAPPSAPSSAGEGTPTTWEANATS